MKRYFKILLTSALLVALAIMMPLSAYADKSIVADKYTFIGSPSYVHCTSEGILILGNDKLTIYSYDSVKLAEYDLPNAIKVEKNENYTVYSTNDGIFTLNAEGASQKIGDYAADFCLAGNMLYSATGKQITIVDVASNALTTIQSDRDVVSLCYADNAVYCATEANSFGYSNIYKIVGDTLTLAYDYCKNLSYLIGGDSLYYYGASRVVNPDTSDSTLLPGDEAYVSVHGNTFYFVTASGELYRSDNGVVSLFFACTSSDKGYFAFPNGTLTDYGKTFVLDYANDRIAVMDDDISYFHVKRPVAMTADFSANLYIAAKDGVYKLNMSRVSGADVTLSASDKLAPFDAAGAVTSMTYSRDELYFTAGGKAYKYSENGSTYLCDAVKVRSEYLGGELFFLRADGIYRDGYEYPSVKVSGVTDFDVTSDGIVYVLKDNYLYKYSLSSGSSAPEDTILTEDGASAITVSVVTNKYTDYGDVIVTCSNMHKVYNLKATVRVPVPTADLQYTDVDNIIRTTLDNAYIYEYPCSVSKVASIPAGKTVIVGKYNLYETQRMSYVLYEDFSGLKSGFVYKGLLSEPALDVAPEYVDGRTLYDNTALYRFPSAQSEKLLSNIGKNATVSLMPFSEYSYNGVIWFKARYNGQTGFLAKDMISTGKYVPTDDRPQYNAKLNEEVEIYDQVSDVFVPTGYRLPAGTQVEIVGVFDQSIRYTLVKYFDETQGLKEGFVPTVALTSYSVTPLQIIGLICVGVIAILLISVYVIKFANKRRRQLSKK